MQIVKNKIDRSIHPKLSDASIENFWLHAKNLHELSKIIHAKSSFSDLLDITKRFIR